MTAAMALAADPSATDGMTAIPLARRLARTPATVSGLMVVETLTAPPDALAVYQNGEASPMRSALPSTPASAVSVAQLGSQPVTSGVGVGSAATAGFAGVSRPTSRVSAIATITAGRTARPGAPGTPATSGLHPAPPESILAPAGPSPQRDDATREAAAGSTSGDATPPYPVDEAALSGCAPADGYCVVASTGRKPVVDLQAIRAHRVLGGVATRHPDLAAQGDHGGSHDRALDDLVLLHVMGEAIVIARAIGVLGPLHHRRVAGELRCSPGARGRCACPDGTPITMRHGEGR